MWIVHFTTDEYKSNDEIGAKLSALRVFDEEPY